MNGMPNERRLSRECHTFSSLIDALNAAVTLELKDVTVTTTATKVDGVVSATYHLDVEPLHPTRVEAA